MIPIIDLAPLWNGSKNALEKLACEIEHIYTTIGFGILVNHHIPTALLNNIFTAAHAFHALPTALKMQIKQNHSFRGFMPLNASQLKLSSEGEAKKPNQRESFIMAFDLPKDHPDYQTGHYLAGPNQWPNENILINFRQSVEDYRDAMLVLAYKLLEVFAIAFDIDVSSFKDYFDWPTYFLRLQYYPKQASQIPDDLYGLAPHTDYGFITLLAQQEQEGLEVRTQKNEWITVPYIPHSLVLNTGDIIRHWTNNEFLSTPHRVINRTGEARYSIPFFFDPNMHTMISTLPAFIRSDLSSPYNDIMYGDYLLERVQSNYGLGKTD